MTENKAIEVLELTKTFDEFKGTAHNVAFDMAIKALEKQSMANELLHELHEMELELEPYRAIGTPTQILEKIGGLDIELGKYYSIGTVNEFATAIEKLKQIKEIISKRDNAFDGQEFGASYSDLDGIIEEIREVVEREI